MHFHHIMMIIRIYGIRFFEYKTGYHRMGSLIGQNPEMLSSFQSHSLGKKAAFPYLCRPFTNNGCGDLLVKRIEAVLPGSQNLKQ